MSHGFNSVTLVGNLTRDPELRFTPGGQALCKLGLAVNKSWKNAAGEKQEKVLFINVVCWGKRGETVAQYVKKGQTVLVNGELELRTWETPGGDKRSAHEVNAQEVVFLSNGGGQRQEAVSDSNDIPF